jgi:hypothetical protein
MKRIAILSGLIALISLTSCNSKKKKEVTETFSVTNPMKLTPHLQRNMFHKYGLLKNIEIRALEKGSYKKFMLMKVNMKSRSNIIQNITYDVWLNIKGASRSKGFRNRITKHQRLIKM